MVKYLLKKSYRLEDLKEVKFQDLWGEHGVFTTMWLYGNQPKILFFNHHINNLTKSLKHYGIKKNLDKQILNLIKKQIKINKNYNHLLRIALNKNIISISIRKRITTQKIFNLIPVNYKRTDPEYKNLKYNFIISKLANIDTKKNDILLVYKKKILETGTSNILLISKGKIYSPKNEFYKGINLKFYEKKI